MAEAGAGRAPAEAHDRVRDVGRRGVGADRLDGVRGGRLAAAACAAAVAYLNQDVAARGRALRRRRLALAARAAARRRATRARSERRGERVRRVAARARRSPTRRSRAMGDPGGGSDFAGFYNHLGIPIADWGFGGAGGVYHSQYDDFAWMTRFGDPSFAYHADGGAHRRGDGAAPRQRRRRCRTTTSSSRARCVATCRRSSARSRAVAGRVSHAALRARDRRAWSAKPRAFTATRDRGARPRAPSPRRARGERRAAARSSARSRDRRGCARGPGTATSSTSPTRTTATRTCRSRRVNEAIRDDDDGLAEREIADLAQRFEAATRALTQARTALTAP